MFMVVLNVVFVIDFFGVGVDLLFVFLFKF